MGKKEYSEDKGDIGMRKSNQHTDTPQCRFRSFHYLMTDFSPSHVPDLTQNFTPPLFLEMWGFFFLLTEVKLKIETAAIRER